MTIKNKKSVSLRGPASGQNGKKETRNSKIAGKKISVFAKGIEPEALEQFYAAMENSFAVTGALLPDAHTGYTLPIGGVIGTDNYVLPSWVGYDIGCGMCAIATGMSADHFIPFTETIYREIYAHVPTGFNSHAHPEKWDHSHLEKTDVLLQIFDKKGLKQMGTLGSGNHFIELGADEDQQIWIIVHSGSRGLGHDIASYYMRLASGDGKATALDAF